MKIKTIKISIPWYKKFVKKLFGSASHTLGLRHDQGKFSFSLINLREWSSKAEEKFNNLYQEMSIEDWIAYVLKNRGHSKFIVFNTQKENVFVQFSTTDGSLLLDIPANDYNKKMEVVDKTVKIIKSLNSNLQYVMGDDGNWRSLNVSLRRNEDLASVLVDRILSECYGLSNYSLKVVVG